MSVHMLFDNRLLPFVHHNILFPRQIYNHRYSSWNYDGSNQPFCYCSRKNSGYTNHSQSDNTIWLSLLYRSLIEVSFPGIKISVPEKASFEVRLMFYRIFLYHLHSHKMDLCKRYWI